MHREIQGQVEKIVAGTLSAKGSRFVSEHLEQCAECREEVSAMQRHSNWMHELRTPPGETPEPRPGFYARVMERIEAEGPISIWNIFIESAFGRRIAYASVALALVLSVYLVTSERAEAPVVASQGVSQSVGQVNENGAALQGDAADVLTATPASASASGNAFGTAVAGDDIAEQMMMQQMMMQQQMVMRQMLNQVNNAGSEDQVLVNLATYQEQ
jgi:anti-sigma factor RsiW